ncbi:hypothetical protein ES703_104786 [subsurface metagenome]
MFFGKEGPLLFQEQEPLKLFVLVRAFFDWVYEARGEKLVYVFSPIIIEGDIDEQLKNP